MLCDTTIFSIESVLPRLSYVVIVHVIVVSLFAVLASTIMPSGMVRRGGVISPTDSGGRIHQSTN
jgi:hypothetical protein